MAHPAHKTVLIRQLSRLAQSKAVALGLRRNQREIRVSGYLREAGHLGRRKHGVGNHFEAESTKENGESGVSGGVRRRDLAGRGPRQSGLVQQHLTLQLEVGQARQRGTLHRRQAGPRNQKRFL